MNSKLILNSLAFLVVVFSFFTSNAQIVQPQPAVYNQKLQSSSLLFIENKGQIADAQGNLRPDILFAANSAGAKLYLSANAIHYQFTKTEYPKGYNPHKREPAKDFAKEAELQKQTNTSTHRFSLELQGANLYPAVITEKQSEYTENYYLPQCPNGIIGVHGYEKITYKNVYPKIDWVIYSKGGFMEYDFLVHPGGDAANIKMKVKDAENVSITYAGELLMKTRLGEVREKAPVSYADGAMIESHFKQLSDGSIGFDVQPQPGKELRIDPSVVWATYYGGSGNDYGNSCAVDNTGNIYMIGQTTSTSAIAFSGHQNTMSGSSDAFVVKFNNLGRRLWSTYYGGSNYEDGISVAVDNIGNAYCAGRTYSNNAISFFGFQNTIGGGLDNFLVKFSSTGTRIWGTYYGGVASEEAFPSITTDNSGNVYLAGGTLSDSGISFNGFQNTYGGNWHPYSADAFLVKFNRDGVRLWATYYGSTGYERATCVKADSTGSLYLTGSTTSTTNIASGGFQNILVGNSDAFIVKFDSIGNRIWATYYGGNNGDGGQSLVIDRFGSLYLAGGTSSDSGISFNGFQNTYGGGDYDGGDAFLVKFTSSGTRLWATYVGGTLVDAATCLAVDTEGNIYMVGATESDDGIASGGFQNVHVGWTDDAFIVKIKNNGSLIWGTYFGGDSGDNALSCALDSSNNLYFTGTTSSNTGIQLNGFQSTPGSSIDAYLTKIDGSKTLKTLCPNASDSITSNFTGPSYQWQVDTGSGFTNITDTVYYSGLTSKTLRLKILPSSFYGYQYRAFVNGNYTEPFQLKFETRWIGTTNSAWENPASWSCGILPDGNTDVIINTGPVILRSNGICRTLSVRPGVSFTIATGNTLTITH